MKPDFHVLVIGGGAAGVGAARELRKQGARVTLVERNTELGGRGRTYYWEGGWRIWGAAAYVGGEPDMLGLAADLGMKDAPSIVRVPEEAIFETIHPRHGLIEVSLDPGQIMRSKAVPWAERFAMIGAVPTVMLKGRKAVESDPASLYDLDTVSACAFFRRYSPSLVDYVLEPIMQQYFGYGEDDYSLAWLLWTMGAPYRASELPWRYAERGVGQLFHAVENELCGDPGCDLHLGVSAQRLDFDHGGVSLTVEKDGAIQTIQADGAVVAVPGSLVSPLIPGLDHERRSFFESVQYVSHHVMHFKVKRPAGQLPKSVLLPTAMGFDKVSNVWTHEHDEDHLRIHGEVKGAFGAESRDWDDDAILDACWNEIGRALPPLASTSPVNRVLLRNDIGLCRRHVGYTQALASFRSLPELPRLGFAGDYLANSTLGRAHRTGAEAARKLCVRLPSHDGQS